MNTKINTVKAVSPLDEIPFKAVTMVKVWSKYVDKKTSVFISDTQMSPIHPPCWLFIFTQHFSFIYDSVRVKVGYRFRYTGILLDIFSVKKEFWI